MMAACTTPHVCGCQPKNLSTEEGVCCASYWLERVEQLRQALGENMDAHEQAVLSFLRAGDVEAARESLRRFDVYEEVFDGIRTVFKHAYCPHDA